MAGKNQDVYLGLDFSNQGSPAEDLIGQMKEGWGAGKPQTPSEIRGRLKGGRHSVESGPVSELFGSWANNVKAATSIDNMDRMLRNLEQIRQYEKEAASTANPIAKKLLQKQAINLTKESIAQHEQELAPLPQVKMATEAAKQNLREAEEKHNAAEFEEQPKQEEKLPYTININAGKQEEKPGTLTKILKNAGLLGATGLSGYLALQANKNNKEDIENRRAHEEKLHDSLEEIKKRYQDNPEDAAIKKEYENALAKDTAKLRARGNQFMTSILNQHMRRRNALPFNIGQFALDLAQGGPGQEDFDLRGENDYGALMRLVNRLPS
jgi:hypothetical protein